MHKSSLQGKLYVYFGREWSEPWKFSFIYSDCNEGLAQLHLHLDESHIMGQVISYSQLIY